MMPDPTCPFCGAAWTAAMLAALDAATDPDTCACCGGAEHRAQAAHPPRAPATRDIACEACGRAIYRAVTLPAR